MKGIHCAHETPVNIYLNRTLMTVEYLVLWRLRRRYLRGYEGVAEERKKLRQENGNAHAVA